MRFYKFEGAIKKESTKAQTEQGNLSMGNERNRKIALKSDAFSEKLQNKAYFFISNMANGTIMGGIIMDDNINIKYQIENYLKSVDIDLTEYRWEEITFRNLQNMLSAANREYFVDDDDVILERFNLDELDGRFGRELDFNEKILEFRDKSSVYGVAKKLLCEDTVIPELDRIYLGGQNPHAVGHPVHYMIETDCDDIRDEISKSLVEALYANDRIYNKRYSLVNIKPDRGIRIW